MFGFRVILIVDGDSWNPSLTAANAVSAASWFPDCRDLTRFMKSCRNSVGSGAVPVLLPDELMEIDDMAMYS